MSYVLIGILAVLGAVAIEATRRRISSIESKVRDALHAHNKTRMSYYDMRDDYIDVCSELDGLRIRLDELHEDFIDYADAHRVASLKWFASRRPRVSEFTPPDALADPDWECASATIAPLDTCTNTQTTQTNSSGCQNQT